MKGLNITPRARKAAKERGLDPDGLKIEGTGYLGGICEKDILAYIKSGGHLAERSERQAQSGLVAGRNQIRVTPLAAKMAACEGVDLEQIRGTGIYGKIQKSDILAALKHSESTEKTVADGAGHGTGESAEDKHRTADEANSSMTAATGSAEAASTADGKEVLRAVPYQGIRKIIGDKLSQSKFTAPHLYFTQKVNMEKLLKLRKEINETQEKKTSVTDYIARACVLALQKYPGVNASLVNGMIYEYKSINLGIAVAAPGGLIVPVVKAAEKKKLLEIADQSSILFEKARNGKLAPNEYSEGTFTISNLGMFGIESFTAIINPPEAAILAVSATKDEPFVTVGPQGEKTISIQAVMDITLSVDHRLIDGLLAAQCVTEIKRLLENPVKLLL